MSLLCIFDFLKVTVLSLFVIVVIFLRLFSHSKVKRFRRSAPNGEFVFLSLSSYSNKKRYKKEKKIDDRRKCLDNVVFTGSRDIDRYKNRLYIKMYIVAEVCRQS